MGSSLTAYMFSNRYYQDVFSISLLGVIMLGNLHLFRYYHVSGLFSTFGHLITNGNPDDIKNSEMIFICAGALERVSSSQAMQLFNKDAGLVTEPFKGIIIPLHSEVKEHVQLIMKGDSKFKHIDLNNIFDQITFERKCYEFMEIEKVLPSYESDLPEPTKKKTPDIKDLEILKEKLDLFGISLTLHQMAKINDKLNLLNQGNEQ